MLERVKAEYSNFLTAPRWRRYLWLGVAAFTGIYLLWCKYGSRPPSPGKVIESAPPPKAVAAEPKKTIATKVQVYREPERVTRKLDLPPPKPREEVQTAADIPKLKNGGTAAVFLNTSTGQTRVEIKAKEAPLIAFERTNYLGGSIGASTGDGVGYRGYYKRDILQIKGAFIQGEGQAIYRPASKDKSLEGIVWANIEYRW